MSFSAPDPIELSTALIARPSVTPEDAGALDVLVAALEPMGFACHDLTFDDPAGDPTRNLYARFGDSGPNFCFAGHTDVVPPGERADWTSDPFQPEVRGGRLYGRGAADMKCAVAAMATAVARFLEGAGPGFGGSISFLITGDEEGDATNGTPKVLGWLAERGERLDACLVGEPTNPDALGDMVKIGRRGSMNARLAVTGVQGHAAYPDLADNPIPRLLKLLAAANDTPLDDGNDHFPASRVTITTVDVGNAATNVIPPRAEARFNVRFNDIWTGASLEDELRRRLDAADAGAYEMQVSVSGESFLTPPGLLSDVVAGAVEDVTGRRPELSTTGGTSDARFIKDFCPVVEFGLINQTAHKVDENAPVEAVEDLARIYQSVLERFFRDAG
jgi:succinyl-diaminopimelate desuccinylase